MAVFDHIYRPSDVAGPLRQGELLTDLRRHVIDAATAVEDQPIVNRVTYPFVVVVSQDCDITQQGRTVPGGAISLPSILLIEVTTAVLLRGLKDINSDSWKLVRSNREERYHFLQVITPAQDALNQGLGELGVDFKRYFTVPTDEFYCLIAGGLATRRCVLNSPYLEHLCSRFANYLSRVALPELHFSLPAGG